MGNIFDMPVELYAYCKPLGLFLGSWFIQVSHIHSEVKQGNLLFY